jgi:membrane-associated protease RseP (regulator of RpoE activity)
VAVNVVSEQDLDLLEEYLDGELGAQDVERVNVRLAEEPAFAAALSEIREQRGVRQALWLQLEPTEQHARQFASSTIREARKQDTWQRMARYTRFGSVAAACVLVGIFVGWLGRDRGPTGFNPVSPNTVSAPLGVMYSNARYQQADNDQAMAVLVVRQVQPGSTAEAAGLRVGDLLLSLDGVPIPDNSTFNGELSRKTGARLLQIRRGNQIVNIPLQVTRQ